jgi:type IV secretion system protein VirD4
MNMQKHSMVTNQNTREACLRFLPAGAVPCREARRKMIFFQFVFGVVFLIVALLFPIFYLSAKAAEKGRQERIKAAYVFEPEMVHGCARFATNEDLKKAGLFKSGGIRIGFSAEGLRPLYFNTAGHLLVVAGARTGKAVTLLVETILSLPKRYSLLVFDPKAELCAITGHWRKRVGEVYVLNPFGIFLGGAMNGLKQACFNPMSTLDPASTSFHAACDKLADAICWEEGHMSDSHWIVSARLLISGTIAALVKYGVEADKNLVAVRNVITGANGRSVYEFCRECMALPDPYIRQKLARFAVRGAEENKELNGIVSTADTQTGFCGNEAIAKSLTGSDFQFSILRRRAGTTVFVCLPLDMLDVSKKYFRIMASSGVSDILREGLRGKGAPVLGILDEVSQIGPLKVLSDAWGMAAGAAQLQLMAVYQNVSQIKAQFQTNWLTMVANSGAAMYFGIRDPESADFVAKQCGVSEVLSRSRSVSIDPRSGEPVVNNSFNQTSRPLLHPDEARFGLGSDEMLLFCDGLPGVCRAKRRPYFKLRDLRGKFRDNPYFQKPSAGFLAWLFK